MEYKDIAMHIVIFR